MKLYYVKDFTKGLRDKNLVSDNVTADDFMKVIHEKFNTSAHPYIRLWLDDDVLPTCLFIDFGSWSQFFVLTGTEEELRGVFGK